MARASFQQTSFRGGEWSQFSQGRSDLDAYFTALNKCLNFLPLDEGALSRRSGLQFLATAKTNDHVRMHPLLNSLGSFMVELTTETARFFSAGALELDPAKTVTSISGATPAKVTTSTNHGWSSGDTVVFLPTGGTPAQLKNLINQQFQITVTSMTEFTLAYIGARSGNVDGSTITWTSGTVARVHEEVTPYQDGELDAVRATQDEDTLFLFHGTYAPREIDVETFAISTWVNEDGPYMDLNTTTTTMTLGATSGSGVTLTASAVQGINDDTGFLSTDVGRVVRLNTGTTLEPSWTWVRIVGYTNTTHVSVDILGDAALDTSAHTTWRMGLFSDTTGWPTGGIFHENRLWVFSDVQRARVDATESFSKTSFSPTDTDGTVADSNGISAVFKSKGRNAIKWLIVDERGMIAGTDSGEWSIRASALDDPLTPFTTQARRVTTFKSSEAEAIQAGKSTVFIQNLKRTLIEHRMFEAGYDGKNVSRIGRHLTSAGVEKIVYAQTPIPMIWCKRTDQYLVGVCFRRDADGEQTGWHQHNINYTEDPEGIESGDTGTVEDIQVLSSSDPEASLNDTLWVVNDRNGVKCVECLRPIFDEATEEKNQFFVDSGVRYTAAGYGTNWTVT